MDIKKEGVQKVFGTLDLFVSLLETEIKYPILQGGILPFWTPSDQCCNLRLLINASLINTSADWWNFIPDKIPYQTPRLPTKNLQRDTDQKRSDTNLFKR